MAPATAPPPHRAERGFPLPLWRGVNSLANYCRTVVSVPPSSSIPNSNIAISSLGVGGRGHRDHRPTEICKANYSRTGPPCPVLQQEVRVFTPLYNGEGLGVGLFIWLLEDGARRPPSYYSLPRPSHEFFRSSLFT